jgi:cell division protein FtsX
MAEILQKAKKTGVQKTSTGGVEMKEKIKMVLREMDKKMKERRERRNRQEEKIMMIAITLFLLLIYIIGILNCKITISQ